LKDDEKKFEEKHAKKIFFGDKIFYVLEGVYEPAEDTFLLAENLRVKSGDEVLEVGTGCGILSVLSAFKAERVIAIDINPYAVRCAKLNATVNGVSEKMDIICGDLSGLLKENGLFDLILFNAPYLPTEENEPKDWIDYAWSGGKRGRELIDRFIYSASKYLKPDGRILLVQSTLSDVKETLRKLRKQKFNVKIAGECKVAFETITLIEAIMPAKQIQKTFETFKLMFEENT